MNVVNIINALKTSFCEIISEDELYVLLSSKKKLIVKVGFDPTTEKLHLGHVVILRKLRLLQEFGYEIAFLIGDFTAMIGDPSGRSDSRKQIIREDIIKNFNTYSKQIFRILNPKLTKIYFNSMWLNFLGITSIVNLMSNITFSRLLERNDFKSRYLSNKPVCMHEFIYPLLQAYDSIFMNADVEFGGIDQKFNFLLTRSLQKRFHLRQQISIMIPILRGLDGKNKMSKSLSNCINIDDDDYSMFCKVMSIPDSLVKEYFLYLGFLSSYDYECLLKSGKDLMLIKMDLGVMIVSLFYNDDIAERAKKRFIKYFSDKDYFSDVDLLYFNIDQDVIYLSDFLIMFKFLPSYSEFKRLIKFKSIKLDFNVVTDRNIVLKSDVVYLLQLGKKKVLKFSLKV